MTTLKNLVLTGIGVASLALGGDAYSQTFEKTENGYKQYNKKGQLIMEFTKDLVLQYDKNSKEIELTREGFRQYNKKGQLTLELTKGNNQDVIVKYKYEKNGNIREEFYIDQNKDGKIDLKKEYLTYITNINMKGNSK